MPEKDSMSKQGPEEGEVEADKNGAIEEIPDVEMQEASMFQ